MDDPSQIGAGVAALLGAAYVVRRTLRPQTVRSWALIAAPVLLLLVVIFMLVASPPTSPLGAAIVAGGSLAGAALGYARARHSHVVLGPKPGTLVVRGNGVLVAILLAAFAVRIFVHAYFGTHGALSTALTDAVFLFALFSVGVARGMLYVIWRRLNAAATRAA